MHYINDIASDEYLPSMDAECPKFSAMVESRKNFT